MSDKPEPLAAILAEMRDFADHRAADAGGERPAIELLRSFADRIEAAAEPCVPAPETNPATLRAALTALLRWVDDHCLIGAFDEGSSKDEIRREWNALATAQESARAALAAPARNVDRFATAVEAMEEWGKYPQSRYKGCRLCPHGDASMVSPAHLTLAEWLFAPAKGGDHA